MKSLLKVLYIALVGALVFIGVLFIARGLRENASTVEPASVRLLFDFKKGSAL